MSGLIQKDICLFLQRSKVLIVLIGIGAIMGFSTDGSFIIVFLTLICAILTVGTISYDEFDNGYPFLIALPITKKTCADVDPQWYAFKRGGGYLRLP